MRKTLLFGLFVLLLAALGFWLVPSSPKTPTDPAVPEANPESSAPLSGVTAEAPTASAGSSELSSAENSPLTKEPTPMPPAANERASNRKEFVQARAAFQAELRAGLKNMPTRASLKQMTAEQAHHFPPYLKAAGEILGPIAEKVAKDPRFKPQAIEFYRECATSDQYPTAVRALCLANFRKQSEDQKAHLPGMPESIEKLADRLNP